MTKLEFSRPHLITEQQLLGRSTETKYTRLHRC